MRVLIIGPGYVGSEAVRLLASQGRDVSTLSRRALSQTDLSEANIKPLLGDITNPESLKALPRNWDWVVNCVSSSKGGVGDYRSVYLEGTRNLIRWLAPNPPKKYVYTSSTGVYGQG